MMIPPPVIAFFAGSVSLSGAMLARAHHTFEQRKLHAVRKQRYDDMYEYRERVGRNLDTFADVPPPDRR